MTLIIATSIHTATMSKKQVVNELHKPARKNFQRRHTIIKSFDDLWQIDLAEFIPYSRENNGFKYILIVIDCFSKFLWTRSLKTKTGVEVANAMADVLNGGRVPRNIQSDNGTEFYNSNFKQLMKKHSINHYSTYSTMKATIAERVIRTVKENLYKVFSLRGKYKWVDILADITLDYNKRKHRTIGMKPIDVTRHTKLTAYKHMKIFRKPRFAVGDTVRISKHKSVFAKGYTGNWTTELFKVVKVQVTNPITYKLEDVHGQPILGGFYEYELQKTKHPSVYLVQKVLKQKGKKLFVQWLGLNERSWINKTDVVV